MGTWEADISYDYPPKVETLRCIVGTVFLTVDLVGLDDVSPHGEECLLFDPVEESEMRLTAGEGDLMPPQEWVSRSCYLESDHILLVWAVA